MLVPIIVLRFILVKTPRAVESLPLIFCLQLTVCLPSVAIVTSAPVSPACLLTLASYALDLMPSAGFSPRSSYKALKKDPTVNCRFPCGNCFHDKSLAISLDTGVLSETPADDFKSALRVLLLPFICWDNYISPAPVFKISCTDFTVCSQTVISLSDFINAL